MNKNLLLQGIKDHRGFSDYWILHLPKHILKPRAEASGDDKDTQILPQQSHPREEAEDCHSGVCNHHWGLRPLETGAVLGMRKERKGKFSLADNNDTKSLKDKRSFQNLWASSPCEISPSLVPPPLWPMRMSLSTSPAATELQDQTKLHTFWHNWFGLSSEVPR